MWSKLTTNTKEIEELYKPSVMELELITRKRITTTHKEYREIKEGVEVEYYGNKNTWIDAPSLGVIKKDEKGFYIEWEDTETATRIDESEQSKSVLINTGFYI